MTKKIRIGIDFDNTIVNYEHLFKEAVKCTFWDDKNTLGDNKASIKHSLFTRDGNDLRWQELQAILYGVLIKDATPFPGLYETLEYFSSSGNFELFIVSHKTTHSSYSKDITFIDKAWMWLEDKKILNFIPSENIFFAPGRKEKIEVIRRLDLDYFIDDLIEVLEDENFPEINKILFSTDTNLSQKNMLTIIGNWKSIKESIK